MSLICTNTMSNWLNWIMYCSSGKVPIFKAKKGLGKADLILTGSSWSSCVHLGGHFPILQSWEILMWLALGNVSVIGDEFKLSILQVGMKFYLEPVAGQAKLVNCLKSCHSTCSVHVTCRVHVYVHVSKGEPHIPTQRQSKARNLVI